jgi:hypothetical protein
LRFRPFYPAKPAGFILDLQLHANENKIDFSFTDEVRAWSYLKVPLLEYFAVSMEGPGTLPD